MRALLMTSVALLFAGCSFTTASGFEECSVDADCSGDRICVASYCVVNQTPEGCGRIEGRTDAENAITFGAALPLTSGGQPDQSELQGLNAILLALEEVNQREGVGGRPFALHICDTAGDADKVKLQVEWLADSAKTPAIITSGSGQTIAASSVSVAKGVTLMTATATSPELTSLLDTASGSEVGLVWRTAPSDAIQGRVMADLLINDPNRFPAVTTVGILYLNDPYGQGLADVLTTELTAGGKTVKAYQYNRQGSIDTAVSALDLDNPDLTILVAFPDDAVRILNAAEASTNLSSTIGHRWLFSDSAKDPALISGLTNPAQINNSFGTAPAQGAGAAYASFASSFVSKFQIDPAQFSFTSHSYDAMYLLALGAAHAVGADGAGEVNGTRIAEGLTRVSSGTTYELKPSGFTPARTALQQGQEIDVVGASGDLNFNPATGEAPSVIELWQVQGDAFLHVENRTPPGA